MNIRPALFLLILTLAHLALVAPFVPLASLLPVGFGALAITAMALSLMLAARWRVIDWLMGGPDKSWMLHRYLGFAALLGTLGHWALASSIEVAAFPVIAAGAEELGNVAAFGLLGLSAAAMVRMIPHHLWKMSHALMGPIFLVAAVHALLAASPLAIGSWPWMVLAVFTLLGTIAFAQTRLNRLQRGHAMQVKAVHRFEQGVDIQLESTTPLAPFRPGQFAHVSLDRPGAESHPFTIAAGNALQRRFVIRSSGDWTTKLRNTIAVGDTLRVSDAEGRCQPQVGTKRSAQLWVAGGIGITPFLASLKAMQPDDGKSVRLLWCIASHDSAGLLEEMEAEAKRLPQLDLRVFCAEDNRRLSSSELQAAMSDLPRRTSLYLCGPESLKQSVLAQRRHLGLRGRVVHEHFDFRGAISSRQLLDWLRTAPRLRAWAARLQEFVAGRSLAQAG